MMYSTEKRYHWNGCYLYWKGCIQKLQKNISDHDPVNKTEGCRIKRIQRNLRKSKDPGTFRKIKSLSETSEKQRPGIKSEDQQVNSFSL